MTDTDAAAREPDPPAPRHSGAVRRGVVHVIEHIYGPLLMVAGFCYFFATSDPAQEVLVGYLLDIQLAALTPDDAFWQTTNLQRYSRTVLAVVLLITLPIFAYSCAYRTLRYCGVTEKVEWIVLMTIPAMCLVAYPLGFYRALQSNEAALIRSGIIWVLALPFALLIVQVIYIALTHPGLERSRLHKWVAPLMERFETFWNWCGLLLMRGPLALIAVIFMLGVIAVGFVAPRFSDWTGPIGVTVGFAIFASMVLSLLTAASRHAPGRFPLILLAAGLAAALVSLSSAVMLALVTLACLVLLWSTLRRGHRVVLALFAGLTASYAIGHVLGERCETLAGCNLIEGIAGAPPPLASVAEAYADMPDRGAAPLRIVAAQGGGLYAAYHTAYYLAARADEDPDFAPSLFAVSGVSGGSVGAGIYWAIRKSGLCADRGAVPLFTCHTDAVDRILRRDYLTPALAGLMFRDNLDNFFPISAFSRPPIDRGNVLERTFAAQVQAWQEAEAGDGQEIANLMHLPVTDSFDPERAAPLLFFNGTQVDTGEKVVVSPVAEIADGEITHFYTVEGGVLSVVNGMVISARFPVVTPPARLRVPTHHRPARVRTIQLADGGYFDNSGIETAVDIIRALRAAGIRSDPIEVIVFNADEPAVATSLKGTFGAPVTAFTSAWRARRDLSDRRMQHLFGDDIGSAYLRICTASTRAHHVNFTVSWFLSRASFDSIRDQVNDVPGLYTARRSPIPGDDCSTRSGGTPASLR